MSAPTKPELIEEYMATIEATPEDALQVGLSNQIQQLIQARPGTEEQKYGGTTVAIVLTCEPQDNAFEELVELALKLKMIVEHTPFNAYIDTRYED